MNGRIVIVGGGIAGSSLAFALSSAGEDVLVLEASETFEDRVRGESMLVWGVAEAQELGVFDVLVDLWVGWSLRVRVGRWCSGR